MKRHRALSVLCSIALACAPGEPGAHEDPDAPPEIPRAPAPRADDTGPVVVFLGTSLTAGLGLRTADETYVSRLAELADSAGIPIEAVNAGVSGDTSAGGLGRLDWVLREPLDLLFLELGANDGLRGQDPDAIRANLTEIVERTRERHPGVRVVVAGMEAPPNLGARYTARFRSVFPAVAASTGASLVPFLLEGVAGVPELNQADGIHPTREGHARMARTAWPVLEPLVRAWYARRSATADAS